MSDCNHGLIEGASLGVWFCLECNVRFLEYEIAKLETSDALKHGIAALTAATQRAESLQAQLDAMRADRDLWRDHAESDGACPASSLRAQLDAAEKDLEFWREANERRDAILAKHRETSEDLQAERDAALAQLQEERRKWAELSATMRPSQEDSLRDALRVARRIIDDLTVALLKKAGALMAEADAEAIARIDTVLEAARKVMS